MTSREVAANPKRILAGKISISTQVAWSADGRRVSSDGYGGTVMTWQIAARVPYAVVKGSDRSTSVTPAVAAASPRFAAAFKEPGGKTLLKTWDEARQRPFHGDGCSRRSRRFLAEPQKGRAQPRRHSPCVRRFGIRSWSTGSQSRSPGSGSGRSPTGREMFRRDEEGGSFDQTTFSPDGRRLATAWGAWQGPPSERKHWVSSWDLETGRERLHLDVPYVDYPGVQPRRPTAGGRNVRRVRPGRKRRAPRL